MRHDPELSSCSIVLIGLFNPAIFHPAWLKAKNIHPEVDESPTNLKVVHNDFAEFDIGTYSYAVERKRFLIETTVAPWVQIADKTRAIFGKHLIHTPVTAFGINRSIHFELPSSQARVALGRKIAPVEPWGSFGKDISKETDPSLTGGMTKLVMTRLSHINPTRVTTNVIVEPSYRVGTDRGTGVFLQLNSHHAIDNLSERQGCKDAIDLIDNRFDEVTKEADKIFKWFMEIDTQ